MKTLTDHQKERVAEYIISELTKYNVSQSSFARKLEINCNYILWLKKSTTYEHISKKVWDLFSDIYEKQSMEKLCSEKSGKYNGLKEERAKELKQIQESVWSRLIPPTALPGNDFIGQQNEVKKVKLKKGKHLEGNIEVTMKNPIREFQEVNYDGNKVNVMPHPMDNVVRAVIPNDDMAVKVETTTKGEGIPSIREIVFNSPKSNPPDSELPVLTPPDLIETLVTIFKSFEEMGYKFDIRISKIK